MGPGVDIKGLLKIESALEKAGAVVRRFATNLRPLKGSDEGEADLEPDGTFETMPSVLFDAVVVPDGTGSLASFGQPVEFLRDQYRHCKPILVMGTGELLAIEAGVPLNDDSDWAIVTAGAAFITAIGKHRNWERATDPPSFELPKVVSEIRLRPPTFMPRSNATNRLALIALDPTYPPGDSGEVASRPTCRGLLD